MYNINFFKNSHSLKKIVSKSLNEHDVKDIEAELEKLRDKTSYF